MEVLKFKNLFNIKCLEIINFFWNIKICYFLYFYYQREQTIKVEGQLTNNLKYIV